MIDVRGTLEAMLADLDSNRKQTLSQIGELTSQYEKLCVLEAMIRETTENPMTIEALMMRTGAKQS